ncbi:MAG TPA: Do family serine endopeptidase [Vicinamibacterales bacterium]|jgi:Do/DeqQ family serine protease
MPETRSVLPRRASHWVAIVAAITLFGGGFAARDIVDAQSRAATGVSASAATAATKGGPCGNGQATAPVASYADIVAKVAPAVVTIHTSQRVRAAASPMMDEPFFQQFFPEARREQPRSYREQALGSGVIVRSDGYILTNDHVVDGADSITVDLGDRRSFPARVVGSDKPSDLAVLKIDAKGLATIPLANSDQVRVGDVVLAVGDPLGVGRTVTMGIISAKGRATSLGDGSYEDFLQTDAPINRGNSGGPLVNTQGELVGINSQIISPSGGSIGIGFAIPSNMAQNVMTQLIDTGSVRRGQLGVTVQGVTADVAAKLGLAKVEGALVDSVTAGSPAEQAGLQKGDVITTFQGAAVGDSNSLRNEVASTKPGTDVTIGFLRNGKARTAKATLGEIKNG